MRASKIQEKFLLLRVKKKDPEAFAKIYDLYITPIYRFIYFKVASQQDAEDLTSELFLKAWQYLTETEDEIENLSSFLYRMARNMVIDFYRRRARREFVGDEEVMLKIEDSRQQNLLLQINTASEMQNIEKALTRIKDNYREVLILYYIEELSIGEIAKILDKSKGSVRVLLHRALKVAREKIKEDEKRLSASDRKN